MLLLAVDALLLLYINAGTGICIIALLQKLFRQPVSANVLGTVLGGLTFSTVYFNTISFWLPVNYVSLIPLFILSSISFGYNKNLTAAFVTSIKNTGSFLFSKRFIYATVPVCIMLLYCWLLPPVNADSAGYHYSTIRWFEEYRAVHGLANIDGRLAYNSASFIIQAAYAFTRLTGQSLYPLNGVLVALFYLWMICRILRSPNLFSALVHFTLLYLLGRVLLVNMSSPTADVLVLVCLAYSIIQIFDAVIFRKPPSYFLLPSIILLYAVIAKLSAYPALLLLLLILGQLKKQHALSFILTRLCIIGIAIYVPWLCRNIILSGYLLYPVPFIDIFNADWKAPKSVLLLDYIYIKRLPINFDDDLVRIKPQPFPYWIIPWMQKQTTNGFLGELSILLMAICSPFYWLIIRLGKIKIYRSALLVWAIIYTCVIIWLINVPEYRFGIVFISFAVIMPFLYAAQAVQSKISARRHIIVLLMLQSAWYIYAAPGKKNIQQFSFSHFLVYPLKDKQYYYDNDTATFKYTLLNSGIRLYHEDSAHNCINANLPCMIYKYGTIEMRGATMADGFKNVQDDVSKNYPFVK